MTLENSSHIRLMKSTFYDESLIKKRLAEFILNATKLSMGAQCLEFEEEFSRYQGRTNSVLFNSGSSANLALIQALLNIGTLRRGDEVAFSALTWSTNIMPILQLGLKPVPVDIEIDTLNVNSYSFTDFIKNNPNIRAFFITNTLGFCEDIEVIENICNEIGIILLEDNCESFGSVYRGRKLGNYGHASTVSLFVGHQLSTIEGGVVCTDDPVLSDMLKMVRSHGWDRNLSAEKQAMLRARFNVDSFYDLYTFYDLGFNLRPTEITGFIGIQQVLRADEIVAARDKNFHMFQQAIQGNVNLIPMRTAHMDVVSNLAYPVICKNEELCEYYKNKYQQAQVEIRPIVGGDMTTQPFFRKYCSDTYALPNANFVHKHGFYFPNNPDLCDDEISRLVDLLRD